MIACWVGLVGDDQGWWRRRVGGAGLRQTAKGRIVARAEQAAACRRKGVEPPQEWPVWEAAWGGGFAVGEGVSYDRGPFYGGAIEGFYEVDGVLWANVRSGIDRFIAPVSQLTHGVERCWALQDAARASYSGELIR